MEENKVVIKSFNKKRRNKSIIMLVGLLIYGAILVAIAAVTYIVYAFAPLLSHSFSARLCFLPKRFTLQLKNPCVKTG